MAPVSEIKLIRTDTTLDLSQKAEKVCLELGAPGLKRGSNSRSWKWYSLSPRYLSFKGELPDDGGHTLSGGNMGGGKVKGFRFDKVRSRRKRTAPR